MKTWRVPVTWEMCGYVEIKANTLQKAIEITKQDDSIPLPADGDYVDGSFQLSYPEAAAVDVIRKYCNHCQADERKV